MSDALSPDRRRWLEWFYDAYPRIEAEFQTSLDASLHPRGPDLLYDLVRSLQLPAGASAIDLGCGEGRHTLELAARFGFVARRIELASEALAEAAQQQPELRGRVHFEVGTAEAIPAADGSVDLVWCRDVLVHVAALEQAYASCRRIL